MTPAHAHHWYNKIFEQYLNTFFRETGVDVRENLFSRPKDLTEEGQYNTDSGLYFRYRFSASDTVLCGSLKHISLTGYHRYGHRFWLQHGSANSAGEKPSLGEKSTTTELTDIHPLLRLICEQLAHNAGGEAERVAAAATLYESMCNSVDKSRFFLDARHSQARGSSVVDDFIAAEQGMVLGHPFHVTSKACTGLSEQEMRRYSPELGASFKLHYFAVAPTLVQILPAGMEITQLIDPVAQREARQLLGERADQYQLVPCHPWQAGFLLEKAEVRRKLDEGAIITLGPLGQIAWPTSSVRTVWLPQSGLFLKLSLDVRITNFIRNNPLDQAKRAIDASRLINLITPDQRSEFLCLLPELATQTLMLPGLEASFGIIYRAGLAPQALAQTRVLGSLVEECPITEALPLHHYLQQAAQVADTPITCGFVCDWWRQYLKVSLLPVLELFARTGISLEAHLQNCLMRFDQGMPVQLVVRDMEGVSVAADSMLAGRSTEVPPDSPVWYTANDAWFRFKYYVVVNHIAHIIGALARMYPVTEATLWQVAGQVLSNTGLSGQAQHYARQLLESSHLPAKANMLSTFAKSGEKPSWVDIPNPLRDHRPTNLTPLSDTGLEAAYRHAEQRVVTQLLESILFEGVVPYQQTSDGVKIPITTTLNYQCQAMTSFSFGRIRIRAGSLQRYEAGKVSAPSLGQIMEDLSQVTKAASERWWQFHDELAHTLIKHAQALQNPPACPIRDMSYFEQEARVNNGHLYHPSFKSRIGFDPTENQRYGPELSNGHTLVWIAVDRALTQVGVSGTTSLEAIQREQFTVREYQTIERQVRAAGCHLDHMVLMPVHPWQWHKIIRVYYQAQLVNNQIIELEVEGPDYLPQQSIRTLSNLIDLNAPSVKLAMSLINTSTSRVLAPHTVQNAAPISDWLWRLVQDDELLPEEHRPIILREIAGVSVTPPQQVQAQYGALACIWRESVYRYLSPGQSATPVTALMQLDIDQRPVIDPWIGEHGINVWATALIERVYLPVMHMLWHHGTALESHAQNMLLVHEDGLPVKVALKDFHDGVRYSRALLANAEARPNLTDAPEAHARVNPNSFLETDSADELRDFTQDALCFVNLAELSWFLSEHYGFPERDFWALARQIIQRYQAEHHGLAERFKLFDFFAAWINVEQLACRRFLPEIRLRTMTIANPLKEDY